LESGKISGLDGSVSSRESGSSSSTSNSDESNDSDSGGDVEIMLSNTNIKKPDAGVEEGEIAEESGTATAEESGENLAGESVGPEDLVKPNTCFMGRSLMKQSDLDALASEGCFVPDSCRRPGKKTTPKPKKD
jgi:hypothetical protein